METLEARLNIRYSTSNSNLPVVSDEQNRVAPEHNSLLCVVSYAHRVLPAMGLSQRRNTVSACRSDSAKDAAATKSSCYQSRLPPLGCCSHFLYPVATHRLAKEQVGHKVQAKLTKGLTWWVNAAGVQCMRKACTRTTGTVLLFLIRSKFVSR